VEVDEIRFLKDKARPSPRAGPLFVYDHFFFFLVTKNWSFSFAFGVIASISFT
jgi:hypothetical protein